MELPTRVKSRLRKFFRWYREKAAFVETLARKKKSPDEVILLVCCYLDQLSGCMFSRSGSNRNSFENILLNYCGEKEEFSQISVADLTWDLIRIKGMLPGIVEQPGRVVIFSDGDKPIIKFIDQTGVGLTQKRVNKFIEAMLNSLKSKYRIYAHQTTEKESYGEEELLLELILSDTKVKNIGCDISKDNLGHLLKEYTYSSILYREYRCKAVHEIGGPRINLREFWGRDRPYFSEFESIYSTHGLFELEFPSRFLIGCLKTCIDCVEKAILGKGLLPLPIWAAICDVDEFAFMDVEGIEESRPIKLKIE